MNLSVAELQARVSTLFEGLGLSPLHAGLFAEVLVEAEIEGNGGHGLSRIPIYAAQIQQKGLKVKPEMRLERTRPAVAILHADHAPGPVAAMLALQEAVVLAQEAGTATVAVRGAGHVGVLSAYVGRLAQKGLVGLAFANTPPAIAPGPVLGTNPIALGAPFHPEPVVIDTSISVVARGKILAAAKKGESIPEGWALDSHGQPTTSPQEALKGSLLPAAGGKGFALAVMVEVLAGVMGGAILSPDIPLPWVSPDKAGTPGFILMALDPSAFGNGFDQRMVRMVQALEAAGGRIPGSRRARLRQKALEVGVTVPNELQSELSKLGLAL